MNKLKFLIMSSDQNDFDKRLTNTIKKFSSERNLFFANLYNNSIHWNSNTNLNNDETINDNKGTNISNNNCGKSEKCNSKSFFRGTLLKRCKSTKEVFTSSTSTTATNKTFIDSDNHQNHVNHNSLDKMSHRQSFNLDEFDKKYLFSETRKNIVKDLRKHFENNSQAAQISNVVVDKKNQPPPPPPRRTTTRKKLMNGSTETLKVNTQASNDISNIHNSSKPPVKNIDKQCSVLGKCSNNNINVNDDASLHARQQRALTRHSFYLHRNDADIYEVGDGCDDCSRVKQKARQLIELITRNEPQSSSSTSPPPRSSKTSQESTKIIEIKNQQELNIINSDDTCKTNYNNYNNNNESINNNLNYESKQNTKTNLDNIFVTRNNLLTIQHQHKRRSLNAAITRDNNLYRNVLSDSFEDSKYGIKKSGSVNKIDLEILKSELDDYVDPKWRANISLGYGFRSQRTLRGSRKELDLEQKIDLEVKMREGSAKLLAACNNSKNSSHHGNTGSVLSSSSGKTNTHNIQVLEAAKNLLTSNERMTAYMAELQRRKRDKDTINNIDKLKPTGKISLSEIRMPLMWRDTDHFKNKGDHRRFAVFCLAKIGTEIYDTSLLCPVDRNLTDVCFNDAILFTNITPDFELKLEVYAVMMEFDLSIASTPRKIKNTIHSSISRTVGKRLAANLKDELNNTQIGPKFDLIATASLGLSDASESAHTHDLCFVSSNNGSNTNSSNKLPLFGHFCCRLAVQPDFYEQPTQTGLLQLIQKEPTRHIDGYARLQAFRIDVWDDEKAFQLNYQPRRCIPVIRESKVKLKLETDIFLINLEDGAIEENILRFKSPTEAQKWYSSLKKAIKEHNQWNHVVQSSEPMQLALSSNTKNYFTRNTRQGSLYDQVPILEPPECRQSFGRPILQVSASGNMSDRSPSLNDFRTRAYSSSRSSSHSSSTLSAASSIGSINSKKSHWPFGNK